jgi:hypothetical protein
MSEEKDYKKENLLFKKEELMIMDKEFIVETLMRLEKTKEYYRLETRRILDAWGKAMEELKKINNK